LGKLWFAAAIAATAAWGIKLVVVRHGLIFQAVTVLGVDGLVYIALTYGPLKPAADSQEGYAAEVAMTQTPGNAWSDLRAVDSVSISTDASNFSVPPPKLFLDKRVRATHIQKQ